MSARVRQTTPKRDMQSRWAQGNLIASTSVITKILHTLTEKSTLTRIIADIRTMPLSSVGIDQDTELAWMISWRPNAKEVARTVAVGELLNLLVPKEELLTGSLLALHNEARGILKSEDIHIDSNSQRKMKVGDQLVLTYIADTASAVVMQYGIKSFWKLA